MDDISLVQPLTKNVNGRKAIAAVHIDELEEKAKTLFFKLTAALTAPVLITFGCLHFFSADYYLASLLLFTGGSIAAKAMAAAIRKALGQD